MKKLFLDDIRNPSDSSWDIVRSYDAFVEYITKNGVPDIISFDHDLGNEHYNVWRDTPDVVGQTEEELNAHYTKFAEKTGYDCAKWLVENNKLPHTFQIHSMNPVGAKNIRFIMAAGYRHMGD